MPENDVNPEDKMRLVHWPECTNDPCSCVNVREVIFEGPSLKILVEAVLQSNVRRYKVVCLDCGWQGLEIELKAQACPLCDGRCADV